MKSEEKNEMWDVDSQLFASMSGNYQSENERVFFETLHERQLWECSISGDMLLSGTNNEDGLFIVRIHFDEYRIGTDIKNVSKQHVMNLSEALSLNLQECGLLDESITLFEWLRRRDYKGVWYDHDYDYI